MAEKHNEMASIRSGVETNLVSPAILPLQEGDSSEKAENLDLDKQNVEIVSIQKKEKIESNQEVAIKESKEEQKPKAAPSEFSSALMMTNICLGTTIFTFAVRAKAFGLAWIIVAAIVCAAINYWTIVRQVQSSEKLAETDYSEVVGKLLGKKHKISLNFFIIIYSYACLLSLVTLIYPLLGRFIQSVFLSGTYPTYLDFNSALWGKAYMKYPIVLAIGLLLVPVCCMKDMSKLNWTAYIGVGSVCYTLLIVTIQADYFYNYYKNHTYKADDPSTHINWVDLGKAFTKKLDFFKGMASLFAAYSCHTGIFPIYVAYKPLPNGITKMKKSIFLACFFTCCLHILSIVCCFLTEPIFPEDIIIYRNPRELGKDIWMNISKLAVAISLFFTIPGYYFGLRCSIANAFTGGKISNKFNIILTSVSIIACCMIGAAYDKILNYLSYIGGFFAVFVCYYYPVRIYIASTGKPITEIHNLIEYIGAIILVIIGLIAGIATIIDDVKKN